MVLDTGPRPASLAQLSTWSIIKKSKVITFGMALVITCLLCAGSIQILLIFLDTKIRRATPRSTPITTAAETINLGKSPACTDSLFHAPSASTEPELNELDDVAANRTEPPLETNQTEPDLGSGFTFHGSPVTHYEENLMVIPIPKPGYILDVVVQVRKVSFTAAAHRNRLPLHEIATEGISNFSYRNLLAIRQVFLVALRQYSLLQGHEHILIANIEGINAFIQSQRHKILQPMRFELTTCDAEFAFPDNQDEFQDYFDTPETQNKFYRTFLMYQNRWNRDIVPLLLASYPLLNTLNCAFTWKHHQALLNRIERMNVIHILHEHYANLAATLRHRHGWIIHPDYAIPNKGTLEILLSRFRSVFPQLGLPLRNYALDEIQWLDYYIAYFNNHSTKQL